MYFPQLFWLQTGKYKRPIADNWSNLLFYQSLHTQRLIKPLSNRFEVESCTFIWHSPFPWYFFFLYLCRKTVVTFYSSNLKNFTWKICFTVCSHILYFPSPPPLTFFHFNIQDYWKKPNNFPHSYFKSSDIYIACKMQQQFDWCPNHFKHPWVALSIIMSLV